MIGASPSRWATISCWSQTWFPDEITSTPESSSSCAVRTVRPRPPAAFSPLATTTSISSSRRRSGRSAATAFLPGLPTMSPMKRTRISDLAGEVHGPRLSHDRDPDLARVLHRLLDLLAHVPRQTHRAEVVDGLRLDDDPHLAPGMDREGLVYTLKAVGDVLESLQALDVRLERLHPGAGPAAADRVRDLDQDRLDRPGLDLFVVGFDAVNDGVLDAEAPGKLRAEKGVRALDVTVDRLAEVVQEGAPPDDVDVGADLSRQERAQLRRLDGVHQLVLAVAGPVLQPAQRAEDLRVEPGAVRLQRRLLRRRLHLILDVGASLLHDLLDACRMDAPVRDEARQSQPRDLPTDAVEGREHDGVWRVVDDQVDPRRVLQGADIPPLPPHHPSLHFLPLN